MKKEGSVLMSQTSMNLLVTLNAGYLHPLAVMLKSVVSSNPGVDFPVYVLHKSLTEEDLNRVREAVGSDRIIFHPIRIDDSSLADAPTSRRYPTEMYYRLFASRYLPEDLDRVLYLDPDLVVLNPLRELYGMSLENHYYAACSHVFIRGIQRFNEFRLNMEKNTPYINSGVLLMNLSLLRQEMDPEEVFTYIRKHRSRLMLPDQDVLSALFGSKTLLVNSLLYNLSELFRNAYNNRLFPGETKITLDWIRENTVIVHYCGKNKPWKPEYVGELDRFFREVADQVHFQS